MVVQLYCIKGFYTVTKTKSITKLKNIWADDNPMTLYIYLPIQIVF